MPDVHSANQVVQRLKNPVAGIVSVDVHEMPIRCAVILSAQNQGLMATTQVSSDKRGKLPLSTPRIIRREKWPRLNWTVVAPDMWVSMFTRSD